MIQKDKVKDYWNLRYLKQGKLTTGYRKHNEEEQKQYYIDKKKFIQKNLPDDLGRVLDYGCGKWFLMKDLFTDYVGYDVVKPCGIGRFDSFFTANVLQHNEDKTVLELLNTAQDAKYIILYEATSKNNVSVPHCVSRPIDSYVEMVKKETGKELFSKDSHMIHSQEHSIMIFK